MKSKNYKAPSPARQSFTSLPSHFGQGAPLVVSVSVARVQPRTSKGITAFCHAFPSNHHPNGEIGTFIKMPNRVGPQEVSANQALVTASNEVLQATYTKLLGGAGTSFRPAQRTPSGCVLTHQSTNRAGPTGYPITQLVTITRSSTRARPGQVAPPRRPNVQANRLVAYLFGEAESRRRLTQQNHQASHLCHEAKCINPAHIVVEPKENNEARKLCRRRHRPIIQGRKTGKRSHPPENDCTCSPPCLRRVQVEEFSSDLAMPSSEGLSQA